MTLSGNNLYLCQITTILSVCLCKRRLTESPSHSDANTEEKSLLALLWTKIRRLKSRPNSPKALIIRVFLTWVTQVSLVSATHVVGQSIAIAEEIIPGNILEKVPF